MIRALRTLAAASALGAGVAACGTPSPDLMVIERAGADANANVTMLVGDGGTVACDGKERVLDNERLIDARALVRDLADQAELGIVLPAGPGSTLRYTVRMEKGTIAFSDRSRGDPADVPAARGLRQGRRRGRLRPHPLSGGRRIAAMADPAALLSAVRSEDAATVRRHLTADPALAAARTSTGRPRSAWRSTTGARRRSPPCSTPTRRSTRSSSPASGAPTRSPARSPRTRGSSPARARRLHRPALRRVLRRPRGRPGAARRGRGPERRHGPPAGVRPLHSARRPGTTRAPTSCSRPARHPTPARPAASRRSMRPPSATTRRSPPTSCATRPIPACARRRGRRPPPPWRAGGLGRRRGAGPPRRLSAATGPGPLSGGGGPCRWTARAPRRARRSPDGHAGRARREAREPGAAHSERRSSRLLLDLGAELDGGGHLVGGHGRDLLRVRGRGRWPGGRSSG